MIGKYRTAKGWRIFIYIFSPLFIVLFIYFGSIPFIQQDFSWILALFCIPASIGMLALFTYGLLDTRIGGFIIENNKVRSISPWKIKQLNLDEIKGFHEDSNYIHIIPIDPQKKKIKVSLYTEKTDEIRTWLSSKFPELNRAESLEGTGIILTSNEFGLTAQSREYRLNEAKRICRIANATGFVLLLWIAFYPRPYMLSLSIALVYPIFILVLLYFYRGLIRLDEKKKSAFPSLSMGFIMAALGLLWRAISDYEILDYGKVWTTTALLASMLFIFIILATKKLDLKNPEDYLHIFGIIISVWIYSVGGFIVANCMYDKSPPHLFKSEVVDKEISAGKTSTYYLKVNPWDIRSEIEKIKVSEDDYNSIAIGKEVMIYQMRGLFETPWFFVDISTESQ
jgi:hypothetical protein